MQEIARAQKQFYLNNFFMIKRCRTIDFDDKLDKLIPFIKLQFDVR